MSLLTQEVENDDPLPEEGEDPLAEEDSDSVSTTDESESIGSVDTADRGILNVKSSTFYLKNFISPNIYPKKDGIIFRNLPE